MLKRYAILCVLAGLCAGPSSALGQGLFRRDPGNEESARSIWDEDFSGREKRRGASLGKPQRNRYGARTVAGMPAFGSQARQLEAEGAHSAQIERQRDFASPSPFAEVSPLERFPDDVRAEVVPLPHSLEARQPVEAPSNARRGLGAPFRRLLPVRKDPDALSDASGPAVTTHSPYASDPVPQIFVESISPDEEDWAGSRAEDDLFRDPSPVFQREEGEEPDPISTPSDTDGRLAEGARAPGLEASVERGAERKADDSIEPPKPPPAVPDVSPLSIVEPVPGKAGFVILPGSGLPEIDTRGIASGTEVEVQDPADSKRTFRFLVP